MWDQGALIQGFKLNSELKLSHTSGGHRRPAVYTKRGNYSQKSRHSWASWTGHSWMGRHEYMKEFRSERS